MWRSGVLVIFNPLFRSWEKAEEFLLEILFDYNSRKTDDCLWLKTKKKKKIGITYSNHTCAHKCIQNHFRKMLVNNSQSSLFDLGSYRFRVENRVPHRPCHEIVFELIKRRWPVKSEWKMKFEWKKMTVVICVPARFEHWA